MFTEFQCVDNFESDKLFKKTIFSLSDGKSIVQSTSSAWKTTHKIKQNTQKNIQVIMHFEAFYFIKFKFNDWCQKYPH